MSEADTARTNNGILDYIEGILEFAHQELLSSDPVIATEIYYALASVRARARRDTRNTHAGIESA